MIHCERCPLVEVCNVPKSYFSSSITATGITYGAVIHPTHDEECLLQAKIDAVINIGGTQGDNPTPQDRAERLSADLKGYRV